MNTPRIKRRTLLLGLSTLAVAGLGRVPRLLAQPGYPSSPAIVKRLKAEINRLLESPTCGERLSSEALQPMPMSPEEFGLYIRDDIARRTKLAQERHIERE